MRVHTHLQHPQPTGPVVLPERFVPLHVSIAAKDVVDQHVEPAAVALDAGDELGDCSRIFVIDDERGTGAARYFDQLAGLLDGLRSAELRGTGGATAAPGGKHDVARAA